MDELQLAQGHARAIGLEPSGNLAELKEKILRAEQSWDKKRENFRYAISKAVRDKFGEDDDNWPWVQEIFDGESDVVFDYKMKLYRCPYIAEQIGDEYAVTLGKEEEVEVAYISQNDYSPVAESQARLTEKAIRADGTIGVKLIAPGWGSSGYFPADVLERDGPKVFTAGTHMYLDHDTAREEAEKPEGSIQDLTAVLETDARYEVNGKAGPGLYADAKVFKPYQELIDELAEHIGVSINAHGSTEIGVAEGKRGRIVKELLKQEPTFSVDFVTKAGAGGKIIPLVESARKQKAKEAGEMLWTDITLEELKKNRGDIVESLRKEIKKAVYSEKEDVKEATGEMQEEVKALKEKEAVLKQENARLKEAALIRHAKDTVVAQLQEKKLPEVTKKRLAESLSNNPPVTEEGKLDKAKLTETIDKDVKAEMEYLADATGSGNIAGMGEGDNDTEEKVDTEKVYESLKKAWIEQGMSEQDAEIAAKGRM